MKLQDTFIVITPTNRCCRDTFAAKYPEDSETGEFPNPDVEVGEHMTCAHCGNIILLTEAGDWETVPSDEVMDLNEPAPVVEVELTNPVVVV